MMKKLIVLAMVLGFFVFVGFSQAQEVGLCKNNTTGVYSFATAAELKTDKCPTGHTFVQLYSMGSCFTRKVQASVLAGNGDWLYADCGTGFVAVSCGSYTPYYDTITVMAGYLPSAVTDGGPLPEKCLVVWQNNSASTQTFYGYAVCCPEQ